MLDEYFAIHPYVQRAVFGLGATLAVLTVALGIRWLLEGRVSNTDGKEKTISSDNVVTKDDFACLAGKIDSLVDVLRSLVAEIRKDRDERKQ